jgi:hypothetical protein
MNIVTLLPKRNQGFFILFKKGTLSKNKTIANDAISVPVSFQFFKE